MEPPAVHVRTPSRLHFGLFSFGNVGRQFGGVGVMIERPWLSLTISAADGFDVQGALADEVRTYVERRARLHQSSEMPALRIEVHAVPRRHAGLGSGTQLALALEAGISALHRRGKLSPEDFARATGRARRSAIGTYGFVLGGLIVEAGRLSGEPIAPLERRIAVPSGWRFVLVDSGGREGLSGIAEYQAFDSLPPVSREVRDQLTGEVHERMIPGIEAGDCAAFGESVFRYGRLAGMCFSSVQGGPYNGQRLNKLVDDMRSLGVHGVGQSSWGPIVFGILPDQASAEDLRAELAVRHRDEELNITISAADNRGAVVTTHVPEPTDDDAAPT